MGNLLVLGQAQAPAKIDQLDQAYLLVGWEVGSPTSLLSRLRA